MTSNASNGYPATIPGENVAEMTLVSDAQNNQLGYGGGFPIGVDFFVYENTDKSRPTSLVIKGDYSYCPINKGEYETIEDTYYTVVINEKGESSIYSTTGTQEKIGVVLVPTYIHQNTEYVIYASIVGPGSNKPSEAHISADISVRNWDIVEQNEEVD